MYNHFPQPALVSNSKDVCNDLDHLQQPYKVHILECEAYGKTSETSRLEPISSIKATDDHGHTIQTAIFLSDDPAPSSPSAAPAITDLNSDSNSIVTVPNTLIGLCQSPNNAAPRQEMRQ